MAKQTKIKLLMFLHENLLYHKKGHEELSQLLFTEKFTGKELIQLNEKRSLHSAFVEHTTTILSMIPTTKQDNKQLQNKYIESYKKIVRAQQLNDEKEGKE